MPGDEEILDTGAGEDVGTDTRSEADLDALADAGGKASNRERPMKESDTPEAKATKAQEQFEFEHGGKKIKGTREQMIKWAQMGYDRPQAMQKFNQEKSKWEQDRQQWEQKWGVYKQIDDFAASNKQWWDFIQQQWNNRQGFNPGTATGGQGQQAAARSGTPNNGQAGDPYAPILQTLEQRLAEKLAPIQQFATEWQQEKVSSQEKAEDSALDQEIQSIRTQYKDLDWDTLNEDGKSLELQILEHAQQTGISSFRAALRDLLHDDLLSRAEAQAKVAVSRGIQAKSKLGVLGTSPTSQKGWSPQNTKSIKDTSYEELEAEIREELRLGKR